MGRPSVDEIMLGRCMGRHTQSHASSDGPKVINILTLPQERDYWYNLIDCLFRHLEHALEAAVESPDTRNRNAIPWPSVADTDCLKFVSPL